MKIDQILVGAYFVLGILFGYVSNYFNKTLSNLTLALLVPIIIFAVTQPILLIFIKQKKKTWVISNSLVTFIFVWLMVWILLHNI